MANRKAGKGSARLGDAEFQAAAKVRSALRRFLSETDRIAEQHGLTRRRYELLLIVRGEAGGANGAVTMGVLAQQLLLTRQSVTELVARAEEAGLLRRRYDAKDARVVRVGLTPAGMRSLDNTFAALQLEREQLAAYLADALAQTNTAARRRS